jgi:periplasmic divalent cation tolerance protein
MTAVIVLTTWPDEAGALAFAHAVVGERLAACVNVLPPMTSVYRWQGKTEVATEHQVIVKTSRDQLPGLEARLVALHPYDLPELLVVDASGGSAAYLDWITRSAAL